MTISMDKPVKKSKPMFLLSTVRFFAGSQVNASNGKYVMI